MLVTMKLKSMRGGQFAFPPVAIFVHFFLSINDFDQKMTKTMLTIFYMYFTYCLIYILYVFQIVYIICCIFLYCIFYILFI